MKEKNRKYSSRRWQRQIIAYCAIGMLLMGVIVGGASGFFFYHFLKKRQIEFLTEVHQGRLTSIEEFLSRAKNVSAQIASRTKARDNLEDYNQGKINLEEYVNYSSPILHDALYRNKSVHGICRFDQKGALVLEIGLSFYESFSIPNNQPGLGIETISDPLLIINNKPYLTITAPIFNKQGEIIGLDSVLFSAEELKNITQKSGQEHGVTKEINTFLVLRKDGEITPLFPSFSESERAQRMPEFEKALNLEEGHITGVMKMKKENATTAFVVFTPVAEMNWGLFTEIDSKILFSPVIKNLIYMACVIFILILAGIAAMILLLRPFAGKLFIYQEELEKEIESKTRDLETELADRRRYQNELNLFKNKLQELVESRTKELRESNLQLRQEIAAHDKTLDALNKRNKQLLERDKQIRCLYHIAAIFEEPFKKEGETIRAVLNQIPSGWQYSEETAARITLNSKEYKTNNFKETPWSQKSDIKLFENKVGFLEVVYLNEKPVADDGPFLNQERNLIDTIAGQISRFVQLKTAHNNFIQSQKMESIGRLAGGIAHDFNNQLTVISGYTDLLIENIDNPEMEKKFIQEIKNAGVRSANLTKKLLTFSRRQPFYPQTINLNDIILNLKDIFNRLLGETIEVKIVLCPYLWKVKADPLEIEDVLMNLVINGRDAMPEGGRLIIETKNVTLDKHYTAVHLVQAGDYVQILVSDTGTGISNEAKKHLFEPFFTTKQKGKGTGLGLSACYGIMHKSKGHIGVYSEPGKGATFKLYFPRLKKMEDYTPREILEPSSLGGNESVLLVDDDRFVIDVVSHLLQSKGYAVETAADGEKALNLIKGKKDKKYDLLITDLGMPKMGGRELIEKIRKWIPNIKVLCISGYPEEPFRDMPAIPGEVEFIQKPFSKLIFSKKVRAILDKQPLTEASSKKLNILAIDDEKKLRELMTGFCARMGYNVKTAFNGEEGLKEIKKESFDVILVDYDMPVMNGLEFIKKAFDLGVDSKIILISGTIKESEITSPLIEKVSFLAKPFDINTFSEAVFKASVKG